MKWPDWSEEHWKELADAEPGGLMACSPELLAEFKEATKTDSTIAETLNHAGVDSCTKDTWDAEIWCHETGNDAWIAWYYGSKRLSVRKYSEGNILLAGQKARLAFPEEIEEEIARRKRTTSSKEDDNE